MSPTIILIFVCCLINSGWSATISTTMFNYRPFDNSFGELEIVQPNVTINLNCSCIISTPNPQSFSETIPGLTVNGKSDYRCNQNSFNDCKLSCLSKKNEPLFNIESRSIGQNMTNGVNLNDYLCGLRGKGDSSTMVFITTQMDCIEKSTNFELFNSKSHSFSMSPSSSSVNCSNDATSTSPTIS
ncbi:uncharacterized protein LOC128396360 [Panonychus citri]|uniref:uncharacterized protein LOC128396360 n=1 Tax=Panonychus citri TaxID=50023 RepID=UPI0023070363|nr:uncharacterized protein LOC128396360 [Panonychus citri]